MKRADEALERLRKRLPPRSNAPAANERRGAESAQPTDAPETPVSAHPLGTTWSVVVSQSPSPGGDAAPGSASASAAKGAGADGPQRARHTFDLVGGAIAALCGTLAIRKRFREARPT